MGALADTFEEMTPTEVVDWMRGTGAQRLTLGSVTLELGDLPTAPTLPASAPAPIPELPPGAIRCGDCGEPILQPDEFQRAHGFHGGTCG